MPIGTRDYNALNVSWERMAVTFENAPNLQQKIKEKQAFGWEVETYLPAGPYVFYYFKRWLDNPEYAKLLDLENRAEEVKQQIFDITSPDSKNPFTYEPKEVNSKFKSKAKTFGFIGIILCVLLVVFSILPLVVPSEAQASVKPLFDGLLYIQIALGVLTAGAFVLCVLEVMHYKKSLEEHFKESSEEFRRSLIDTKRDELLKEQASILNSATIVKNNVKEAAQNQR